eukprot:320552-Chlamydomonas_euryale.AAC.5
MAQRADVAADAHTSPRPCPTRRSTVTTWHACHGMPYWPHWAKRVCRTSSWSKLLSLEPAASPRTAAARPRCPDAPPQPPCCPRAREELIAPQRPRARRPAPAPPAATAAAAAGTGLPAVSPGLLVEVAAHLLCHMLQRRIALDALRSMLQHLSAATTPPPSCLAGRLSDRGATADARGAARAPRALAQACRATNRCVEAQAQVMSAHRPWPVPPACLLALSAAPAEASPSWRTTSAAVKTTGAATVSVTGRCDGPLG